MSKTNMPLLTIPAKELGQILLKNFCPRCFWFTRKFPLNSQHPYSSPMAGIVSIADKYIKRVVRGHIKKYGNLPFWLLTQLNDLYSRFDFQNTRHIKPGRWEISLFNNSCILKGEADDIFEFLDGSWFIVDYKLASFTEAQKDRLSQYEAQLNTYAYLAQKLYRKSIIGLALIYFEPEYKETELKDEQILHRTKEQFMWGFRCTIFPIEIKGSEWIESLCKKMYQILSLETPPEGNPDCQGCKVLFDWWNEISKHLF